MNPDHNKDGEQVYVVYVDKNGGIEADVKVSDHGYASINNTVVQWGSSSIQTNQKSSGFSEPTEEEKLKLVEDLAGPYVDGRVTFGVKKTQFNKDLVKQVDEKRTEESVKIVPQGLRKKKKVYRTPAGPNFISCGFCDAKFSREQSFYGHLTCHKGEALFKCPKDDCGIIFDSLSAFKKHSKEHSNWRPFRCEACGLTFDRPSQLAYHVKRNHEEKKDHACKICGKEFFKRSDLKQHLNLHLGIKKHTCETCGHTFSHVSNLNRHKRTHTREKPYVCEECGKRFSQTSSLNNHARIHATKIFAMCPGCPKKFKTGKLLLKHLKDLHFYNDADVAKVASNSILFSPKKVLLNGEEKSAKTFYCSVCGKQFSFKSALKNHIRSVHEKEKFFICKSCKQKFTELKHLVGHSCVNAEEKTVVRGVSASARKKEDIKENLDVKNETTIPIYTSEVAIPLYSNEDDLGRNSDDFKEKDNVIIENKIPLYSNEVDAMDKTVDYPATEKTSDDNKHVDDMEHEDTIQYDESVVIPFVSDHDVILDDGQDVVSVQYSVINGENTLEVVVENEHNDDNDKEDNNTPEELVVVEQNFIDQDSPVQDSLEDESVEKVKHVVTHTEQTCDEHGEVITKQVTIISIGSSEDTNEESLTKAIQFENNDETKINLNVLLPEEDEEIVDNADAIKENNDDSYVVEFFTDNGDTLHLSDATTLHITAEGDIICAEADGTGQMVQLKEENDAIENTFETVVSTLTEPPNEQKYRENCQKKSEDIVCKICDRTFTRMSGLNNHMGIHLIEKRKHKCDKCGERFAWKSTLNRHDVKVHVDEPQARLKCDICDKSYVSANLLSNHVKRDHENERKNKCNNCGKLFYKQHDLKVHLRTHFGIKPYMCSTCGKEFSHSSHIIRHERTHSGVKPYKCDQCPKSFTQSGTLKYHASKHHGEDLTTYITPDLNTYGQPF